MTLPTLKKTINQETINRYARASGDFNPIHVDEEFARKTPAGGTIAHGMLVLAYVSQMMTEGFGRAWLTGGRLEVRFKTPARPGDTLTINGRIRKETEAEDRKTIVCEVLCSNQKGEAVITGDAIVKLAR